MISTKLPSQVPIKRLYQILAGKLFDPLTRTLASNQVIIIDRDVGIVLDVKSEFEVKDTEYYEFGQSLEITKIDLSHLVVLPGLIDVHVHCKLPHFLIFHFFFGRPID
jgi:imidazolonepropionase-like amidohydrolase